MEILNNREIAILAWAVIFLLFLLKKIEARNALSSVLKTAFHPVLVKFYFLYVLYFLLCLFCLSGFYLWELSLLKSSIIWFFSVGLLTASQLSNITNHTVYFKDWILNNIKAIFFIEYLISRYPFSLPVEFIILPACSLLAIMSFMAEKDPKHKSVKVLCDWILALFGLFLMGNALQNAYRDAKNIGTLTTFIDIANPLFLSLAMLPFLYALFVYFSYERVFIGINFGIKDRKLKSYAKIYSALHFGTNVDFLDRWKRKIFLTDIQTKEDLKRSFREMREVKKREKNPPEIDLNDGWSPYKAKDFLIDNEIITSDYHEQYDEWFCGSNTFKIEDGYNLSNNIGYYINGNATTAKKLKLILNVYNIGIKDKSEDIFQNLAKTLLEKSLPDKVAEDFESFLMTDNGTVNINNYLQVSLETEEWKHGIKGGYHKTLTIENIS